MPEVKAAVKSQMQDDDKTTYSYYYPRRLTKLNEGFLHGHNIHPAEGTPLLSLETQGNLQSPNPSKLAS